MIQVEDHPFFQREGDDLWCNVPVSFPTLVLGGEISVPTLNESTSLSIPRGTQAESNFRLRGKGMPLVSGRGHGDLYVSVQAMVPTSLSREQKELVEKLNATMPKKAGDPIEASEADERPFFDRVRDMFG